MRMARETNQVLAGLLQDGGTGAPLHLRVRAADDEETEVLLPASAARLLLEALGQMAQGHAVTVIAAEGELTTQQAADLLRVSRPFLIKLLDAGQIPWRKVGAHRRVLTSDVLEYAQRERARRVEVMAQLRAETERLELGL
jgi:excisionase family DNA binding protein